MTIAADLLLIVVVLHVLAVALMLPFTRRSAWDRLDDEADQW